MQVKVNGKGYNMGLAVFENLKRKIKSVPVEEFIKEVAEDKEAELADLNIFQLKEGKDNEGETIEPEYTPFTKQIKAFKGQPTDRVTLEDTGAFHRSLKADVRGKKIHFDATDPKTTKLVKKYGGQIFGLDDESKWKFSQDILKDELIEKTRNYMTGE